MPHVSELVQLRMARRADGNPLLASPRSEQDGSGGRHRAYWTLSTGAGSRRLFEIHCHIAVQQLLCEACGKVCDAHSRRMPRSALMLLLDILSEISTHAATIDSDLSLRDSLLLAQAADKVRSIAVVLCFLNVFLPLSYHAPLSLPAHENEKVSKRKNL